MRAQVNADAPTYTDDSTGVSVKPVASSQVVSNKASGAQADGTANAASNTVTASATPAGVSQFRTKVIQSTACGTTAFMEGHQSLSLSMPCQ